MPKGEISYAAAIQEIETLLDSIENAELDVDELARKVKRISFLIRLCRDKLKKTEAEVEKTLKEMEQEED
jgi:exodeoxyribonuclease VII small subunit